MFTEKWKETQEKMDRERKRRVGRKGRVRLRLIGEKD